MLCWGLQPYCKFLRSMTVAKSWKDSGLRDHSAPNTDILTGVKNEILTAKLSTAFGHLNLQKDIDDIFRSPSSIRGLISIAHLRSLLNGGFKIILNSHTCNWDDDLYLPSLFFVTWSQAKLEYGVISYTVNSGSLLRPTEKDQRCIWRHERKYISSFFSLTLTLRTPVCPLNSMKKSDKKSKELLQIS